MEAQFLEQGYLIVRECIPPAELGRVRGLVDRFFEHAREDFGDDTGCGPSHGRLKLNNHLRPETAALVDVCLTESTLGVSRTVLGGLPTSLNFMTVRRPDPSVLCPTSSFSRVPR